MVYRLSAVACLQALCSGLSTGFVQGLSLGLGQWPVCRLCAVVSSVDPGLIHGWWGPKLHVIGVGVKPLTRYRYQRLGQR